MHHKRERCPCWRRLACAAGIALGSYLCGHATAAERPSRTMAEAARVEEDREASRFAERVKRHQRRHFSKERREFHRLQARLEKQRRMRKARMKARQFAVARRHVAEQASKHRLARETGKMAGTQTKSYGNAREGRNSPDGDY